MARRGLQKYMDRRTASAFKIQITSMVDMFVILLVFLLKSFSTSPVQINPQEGVRLPESSTATNPVDVVKLIVSPKAVFVENKKVMDLDNGHITGVDMDKNDPLFLKALYDELDGHAKRARDIASKNEALEFDGRVLLQADRQLNYALLQKVMYTSMIAGYANVKIAVVAK